MAALSWLKTVGENDVTGIFERFQNKLIEETYSLLCIGDPCFWMKYFIKELVKN
jgi:hypothetical protein